MKTRLCAAALLLAASVALPLVSGCGGSSVNTPPNTPIQTPTGGDTIGSSNRSQYSEDTLILAARLSETPWISTAAANGVQSDLTFIRRQVPGLDDVHALPDYDLTLAFVAVRPGTAWANNWRSGNTVTGQSALDAVLAKYNLSRVSVLVENEERVYFRLEFAQPLAISKLTAQISGASSDILEATPSGIVGDGNRIERVAQESGVRVYTFSRGSGDCPSGCINRRFYEITLTANNTLAMREYGDPLPASPTP